MITSARPSTPIPWRDRPDQLLVARFSGDLGQIGRVDFRDIRLVEEQRAAQAFAVAAEATEHAQLAIPSASCAGVAARAVPHVRCRREASAPRRSIATTPPPSRSAGRRSANSRPNATLSSYPHPPLSRGIAKPAAACDPVSDIGGPAAALPIPARALRRAIAALGKLEAQRAGHRIGLGQAQGQPLADAIGFAGLLRRPAAGAASS